MAENNNTTYDDFDCLNENFYELFGRLYENRELLPANAFAYMGQKLLEQYKFEYELWATRKLIPDKQELFRLNAQGAILIPRKIWLLFKNKCAKLSLMEVAAECRQLFKDREFAFDELYPGQRKKTRKEKRAERKKKKAAKRAAKAARKAAKRHEEKQIKTA